MSKHHKTIIQPFTIHIAEVETDDMEYNVVNPESMAQEEAEMNPLSENPNAPACPPPNVDKNVYYGAQIHLEDGLRIYEKKIQQSFPEMTLTYPLIVIHCCDGAIHDNIDRLTSSTIVTSSITFMSKQLLNAGVSPTSPTWILSLMQIQAKETLPVIR